MIGFKPDQILDQTFRYKWLKMRPIETKRDQNLTKKNISNMNIHISQLNKKKANGRFNIYFAIASLGKTTYVDSGLESVFPLVKTKGAGIGVVFNKKEPAATIKQRRLENLYWEVEAIRLENPTKRPAQLKTLILKHLGKNDKCITLARLLEKHTKKVGKSTGDILKHTAKLIAEYDPTANLGIDETWLEDFNKWMEKRGISTNGASIHLRNIRTIFNAARKDGDTKNYPFIKFKIKTQKKAIKAMNLQQLRKLQKVGDLYTDLFMLMFYLAGINIGDLLLCKGLTNGRLVYARRKTGKTIDVPVYPEAMEIIEKYKGVEYLLNVMDTNKDEKTFNQRMNKRLKALNIYEGLCTYVAQYTFASIAAECGISRDIIAACLGHSWADVTSHYVAYSQKQIDEAIRRVIDLVIGDGK